MWINKISDQQLAVALRWNVETFTDVSTILEQKKRDYPCIRLADLIRERKGSLDPQKYSNREFYYIGLENVQSLTGDIVGEPTKLGHDIRSRSKIFSSGDILYGRLRPYLNKVYLCSDDIINGICSNEFFVLTPDTARILPNLMRMILTSSLVQDLICKLQSGSALPRIQVADLLNITIPLPPLKDQQALENLIIEQVQYRRKLSRELQELPYTLLNSIERSLLEK